LVFFILRAIVAIGERKEKLIGIQSLNDGLLGGSGRVNDERRDALNLIDLTEE
jgi:hypothetical protein